MKQTISYKTHYQVLGVSEYATREQIKQAYHRLAKNIHPDRNKKSSAHKDFIRLQEAYDILSNYQKRESYDELQESLQRDGQKHENKNISPQTTVTKTELFMVNIIKRVFLVLLNIFIGLGISLTIVFLLNFIDEILYNQYSLMIVIVLLSIFALFGLFIPYSVFQKIFNIIDPYLPQILRVLNKKVDPW